MKAGKGPTQSPLPVEEMNCTFFSPAMTTAWVTKRGKQECWCTKKLHFPAIQRGPVDILLFHRLKLQVVCHIKKPLKNLNIFRKILANWQTYFLLHSFLNLPFPLFTLHTIHTHTHTFNYTYTQSMDQINQKANEWILTFQCKIFKRHLNITNSIKLLSTAKTSSTFPPQICVQNHKIHITYFLAIIRELVNNDIQSGPDYFCNTKG